MIDHKKHLKANIGRNLSPAMDFHTIVMVLLMRELARKNKGKYTISSESKVENSNDITDVAIHSKRPRYFEIQKEFTKKWENKIIQRDMETATDTIPIPIKQLEKELESYLNRLREEIKKYI